MAGFRDRPGSRVAPWLRIPLIILASLLLLLTVLLHAWRATDEDITRTRELANRRLTNVGQIDTLNRHDYQAAIDLRNATLARDTKNRIHYLALAESHINQADEIFAALGRNINHPAVRLAYEKAAVTRRDLSEQRERYFQDDADAGGAAGMRDLHESTRPAREKYQNAIGDLRETQDALAMDGVAAIAIAATQQSRRLLMLAWVLSGLMLIATGVLWRRQVRQEVAVKDREIRQLIETRTVLVREVHHRIKNHLQGLMGLIQDQQRLKSERSGELDTLLGHVMSLVAVHGMQARSVSEQVLLVELVSQQVALFRQSRVAQDVAIAVEPGDGGFAISAENAVPLALVISELLLNACKHGDSSSTRGIRVRHWQDSDGAHVEISNPAAQPVTLDLERDQGLGTGLSLIKSMLIDLGEITARNHDGCVKIEVFIPHANDARLQVDTAR